ncbi:MAG: magnesium transporter [Myxococcota bacterium]
MPRHPDTAARHVLTRVPVARPDDTVAGVLAALPGAHDTVDTVYVLDAERRLLGRAPLAEVLAGEPGARIATLLRPAPSVPTTEPPGELLQHVLHHAIAEMPVVDAEGRFVGVVPSGVLMRMLRREHVEDLHRLAGITREAAQVREALGEAPTRRVRHRLPWLLVGLAGVVLSAGVMGRFEDALADHVAVAYFVPGIVYLADAIGTQTEAIAVRALSLARMPLSRMLVGELWTGALVGGVLAGILGPVVWLGWGDARLAAAVAVAVLVAGAIATTIGLLLPWVLHASGRDPAFGSGPLATIIQDVLSLLVYFGAVSVLVR